MEKKLYRDEHNKVIGGVCSGLADYLSMDVTALRLIFAFAFFIMGVGLIPYIILWIVLPKKYFNPFITPSDPSTVNYIVPPITPGEPYVPVQPKRSNGGMIAGVILILVGTAFLLNQFNFIPFWEMRHYGFPLIIVAAGIALIVSGQKRHPWEHSNWNQTQAQADQANDPAKSTNITNDNNPTI